jgi:hypothetical protein
MWFKVLYFYENLCILYYSYLIIYCEAEYVSHRYRRRVQIRFSGGENISIASLKRTSNLRSNNINKKQDVAKVSYSDMRLSEHREENMARPKNRSIVGQIEILIQKFTHAFWVMGEARFGKHYVRFLREASTNSYCRILLPMRYKPEEMAVGS